MSTAGKPISDAHLRLGETLRRVRHDAGVSTRSVCRPNVDHPFFSSGHVSLVERGLTAASWELIEAYCAIGGHRAELSALHAQMLTATHAAGRKRRAGTNRSDVESPPHQVTASLTREMVQQHYVVTSHRASYTMGADGSILDLRCDIALRARNDNVRLFYAGHGYPADPRPGVLEVDAVTGCTVAARRESPTGAVATFFELDRALLVADRDPYVLTLQVRVHSACPSAPYLRYHAERGNEHLAVSVRFDEAARPARVWWFAVADVLDAEFPHSERELSSASGVCRREFDGLVPGWCYGIGWLP